jgi:hypothetical protein
MDQNQESSLFDVEIDPQVQTYLSTISKWTKFIAITGFVVGAIFLLAILVSGEELFTQVSSLFMTDVDSLVGVLIVVMVIIFVMCGAWLYFLLRASTLIKKALLNKNPADLAEAFKAFRNFFIISIIFSALSILSTLATF